MGEKTTTGLRNQSSPPREVIIFGSGACAQKIADNLSAYGIKACLAAKENTPTATAQDEGARWLSGVELTACRGFAGNFELTFRQQDTFLSRTAPAIVVAEDDHRCPAYAPYGIESGSRVMSISRLEAVLAQPPTETGHESGMRFAFLCGWKNDSHPVVAQRMLTACLHLQKHSRATTYFMTGNLKVSAGGAETIVQAARRAGTLFFKFTHTYPTVRPLADGRFQIDYLDELTRTAYQVTVDWIVVDETVGPDRRLDALAQRLEIRQDGIGFAQSDNVRRLSNATNRNGVFVAGGSRGILSADEQLADADQVCLNVLTFLDGLDDDTLPTVEIHRGRCARCLTCHRLCPHQAIAIGPRMSVVSAACRRCGICMAGCPARAIDMEGVQIDAEVDDRMRKASVKAGLPAGTAPVLVFGCARSAGQAYEVSRIMGHTLPKGVHFVEVPCGGSISSRHLLAAFEAGARGVMLCICHTDNCQSEIGNRVARRRAESAGELLTAAGMETDRLAVAPVAANMGNELVAMINGFVDRINAIDAC